MTTRTLSGIDEATAGALAQAGLTLLRGREGFVVTEGLIAKGYTVHGAADLRRRYQAAPAAIDAYMQGVDLSRIVSDAVGDTRRLQAARAQAAAGTNPVLVAGAGLVLGGLAVWLLLSD